MNLLVRFLFPLMMALAVMAQPPVLDRELFFDDPEIVGGQLSPDGKYVAFLKPWNKTRNIWVKRTEEPFSAARLVTADTKRPIPGYFWSRDGKHILGRGDTYGRVDPITAVELGQQKSPAFRPGFLLNRATSYSPTDSRLQYHRG